MYRVGQKVSPTDLSINLIKTCQRSYFFVKVECQTTTEVNANKHLFILNILSPGTMIILILIIIIMIISN